jgi:hypothetical protein
MLSSRISTDVSGGLSGCIFVWSGYEASDGSGGSVAHVEGSAQSLDNSTLMFLRKFGVDGQ